MTSPSLSQRVRELGAEIAAAVEDASVEAFHSRRSEEAWSAAEVVGHASEFPVTFATQAVALAEAPGLRLGRTLDDPGRLAAAARLGDASPQQAAAMMRNAATDSARLIESIPADCWDVTGVRVMNGAPFSVRQVVEELIVVHLQGHLAQVRQMLADG